MDSKQTAVSMFSGIKENVNGVCLAQDNKINQLVGCSLSLDFVDNVCKKKYILEENLQQVLDQAEAVLTSHTRTIPVYF